MSTKKRSLSIGLFGFGVVGKGLYDVLQEAPTLNATIKRICIKNLTKAREIKFDGFTTNANELLEDPTINVIVELIDDADAAFRIVKKALENGKAVVTANKKMIATNLPALLALQEATGSQLLYEASCCASIPIIRSLEEYYDIDQLHMLRGIINGSTNFILTKMTEEGLIFSRALLKAQQLGFAERDPALDIQAHDAANKLSILLAHGFGNITSPASLLYSGISNIGTEDCRFAREKGYKIKLVATIRKLRNNTLAAFILPQFVNEQDELSDVSDEFNAIVTETNFADRTCFYGKGAGALPTAAAVLSDLAAIKQNYRYQYKKLGNPGEAEVSGNYFLRVYISAPDLSSIPGKYFEWIEEWQQSYLYNRVVGIIKAKNLMEDNWWRMAGISIIAFPDPIVEDIQYRNISQRSLALAGCV